MTVLKNSRILRWAFLLLIALPGIPFVAGSMAFLIYTYWPRDLSDVSALSINPIATHVSISAHGVNDKPSSWSDELQQIMSLGEKQQAISLDWRPFSDNILICSVLARKIGFTIGQTLASSKHIKSIHAIGHSCGAFVVLGICEGAKNKNRNIKIHTTYLDPLSIYAGFRWDYGIEHFGQCANFSDAYIDTGDTVPGSNQLIPFAHTFDVTEARKSLGEKTNPHNWPTKYYLKAASEGSIPQLLNTSEDLYKLYPRGKLQKVLN